jgi:hypothetical protein
MNLDQAISDKFALLLKEGEEILRQHGWPSDEHYHHPEQVDYVRFRTEALNLVRRVCGPESDHYLELRRLAEDKSSAFNSYYFRDCFAVLQAASRDLEHGLLAEVRVLVAAEVLDDFIEQAEYLLRGGYHIAAASLSGAVLEDTLRKLAEKNGLTIPDRTKLDPLNAELAKAGAYNKLVQKSITAYSDIRNNADHGHFDQFEKDDVEAMVKWVRRFVTEHLS